MPTAVHAVPGGGVDHEAAPAAADVEHALSLAQAELLADQLELGLLGLLERRRPARPVRAAVGHRAVEEQREELVADVVVVAHRAPVARERVPATAQPQLGGRHRRRYHQPAGPDERERQARLLRHRQRRRLECVDHAQSPLEVVDVDHAGDVGTTQAELPGRPEHVSQGARSLEGQRRRIRLGGRHLGPVPEAQPERTLGQRAGHRVAKWSRLRQRHSGHLRQRHVRRPRPAPWCPGARGSPARRSRPGRTSPSAG